ncbi:MAG: ABC-type bacteriocin transporter, partial [Sediminibacterium sp.]|nr:ABC-type bacteriocin transporter [Sediminibacterium sp.]
MHKKWQRTLMENGASLETQLVESLNAAGTIKRFGLEAHTQQKTENAFIILLQSIYKSSTRDLYLGTAAELATHLFTIIILWAGSYYVINREMSPGELLSFYALAGYFTGPASSLIAANKQVQDALIAADRLFEIIDLETETQNEHKITLTAESLGDIVFQHVHFRYGTRVTVFAGLNICLQKNKMTAIVGESGSGKSTLLSLLQNLYPLQEGTISIGGIDLAHISNQSLRQVISVVPQQVDLFAGTIIENIALGDADPDMQKILRLSQSLGIDGFVDQLPAAYHTLLHEQGVNLSGGQRQRIAIARALYRDPEILILDEATSSLDPESEGKVQSTLAHFRQRGKTIIIIAHRLSTIQHADTILVLKQGRLAEQGTHTDLLAAQGMYYHLWKNLQGNE